jgi:hypothetical protein
LYGNVRANATVNCQTFVWLRESVGSVQDVMGGENVRGALDIHDQRGTKKSTAFGKLFDGESDGGWAALFPGFENYGEDNEEGRGGVGQDHGRSVEKDTVGEPEKDASEIKDQHAAREVATALFLDFDELWDEGEGGAEAGDGAEDFDGLRSEQVVEVSWFYFSRR